MKRLTLLMAALCLIVLSGKSQGFSDEGFPADYRDAKHFTWDGSAWKEDAHLFADTTSGNPPTIYRMDAKMSGNFVPYQRFNITYDSAKRVVLMISEQNNGSNWEVKEKDTIMYNTVGDISNRYKYQWKNSAWENYYKNTYTVDTAHRVIERFEEDWNGSAWQNDDDYFFHYGTDGRLTDILDKDWQGSWVDRRRNLINYAGSVETDVVKQELKNGTWTNEQKFEFAPTGQTVIAKVNAATLEVYPNPANSTLRLTLASGKAASIVTIKDIAGKVIINQMISGNTSEVNISRLKSGIYFVNCGTVQTKFVKQ